MYCLTLLMKLFGFAGASEAENPQLKVTHHITHQ